jgi:hypothetical protein
LSNILWVYNANIVIYRFFSFWIWRNLAEVRGAKWFNFYLTPQDLQKSPLISNGIVILFIFA